MINSTASGHRKRLRDRFTKSQATLTEQELVELLLTYAIPRKDVAPLAAELLDKFGSIASIINAEQSEILAVKGIGDQAATLIRLMGHLHTFETNQQMPHADEVTLSPTPPIRTEPPSQIVPGVDVVDEKKSIQKAAPVHLAKQSAPARLKPTNTRRQMGNRTFTNDLAQTALDYVPLGTGFASVEHFETHLLEVLPYNSANSRKRYASNLINRYFADGSMKTPLIEYLRYERETTIRADILFFETVRVENTLKTIAEKSIWPALPAGKISREQLRNFLRGIFPNISDSTMKRMLYSVFNVYSILNKATTDKENLYFNIREGSLSAFVYILAAEFPEPGIYDIAALEAGPMRRWLLWDRGWMRKQLYNLQDLGVLAKVNEIDTIRQFTLTYDQFEVLKRFFVHPRSESIALREDIQGSAAYHIK